MKIDLPPELDRIVESLVASGRYAGPSDVVSDALRRLFARDRAHGAHHARLQSALEVGLSQAERGELLDGPRFVESLRASLRAKVEDSDSDARPDARP